MHVCCDNSSSPLAPPLLARPAGVVTACAHAHLVVLRSAALRLVPILALLTETSRASQSAKVEKLSFERSANTTSVAPEVVLAGEFILAVLLLRIAEIILGARLLLLLVSVVVLVARLLLLAPAVRRCNTTQKRSSARCAKGRKLHRGP